MALKAHKTSAKFLPPNCLLKGNFKRSCTETNLPILPLFFSSFFIFLSSFLCRSPPPPPTFSEELWPPCPLHHSRLFFPFVSAQVVLWEVGRCPTRWIQLAFPTAWQARRISTSLCLNPSVKLRCYEAQTAMLYVAYEARWYRTPGSIKDTAGTWKLPQTRLFQV